MDVYKLTGLSPEAFLTIVDLVESEDNHFCFEGSGGRCIGAYARILKVQGNIDNPIVRQGTEGVVPRLTVELGVCQQLVFQSGEKGPLIPQELREKLSSFLFER